MKLTDKYNKTILNLDKPVQEEESAKSVGQTPSKLKMEREILETEIRSIIAKAYITDEPQNQQPIN